MAQKIYSVLTGFASDPQTIFTLFWHSRAWDHGNIPVENWQSFQFGSTKKCLNHFQVTVKNWRNYGIKILKEGFIIAGKLHCSDQNTDEYIKVPCFTENDLKTRRAWRTTQLCREVRNRKVQGRTPGRLCKINRTMDPHSNSIPKYIINW